MVCSHRLHSNFLSTSLSTLCLFSLFIFGTTALTTKINAGTEWCFTQPYYGGLFYFQFTVDAGGQKDIDATIRSSNGNLVEQWKAVSKGEYHTDHQPPPSGTKFVVCFNNEMARFTPKWVNFYIHLGPSPLATDTEALDPLETQLRAVGHGFNEWMATQQKVRVAERAHRAMAERAADTLLLLRVVSGLAMVGMGVLQVVFLRRFLERRAKV